LLKKTWFIKVLILRPTFNFKKISGGYTPVTPLKGRGEGKGRRGKGQGRGAPPIHIPGYATVFNGTCNDTVHLRV